MNFYAFVVGFIFVICYANSVCFRLVVKHPFKTIFYGISDGIDYIAKKRWNECPTGKLIAYTALFGRGKTLSVVHYVLGLYNKYNNKMVYCRERKKFVTQKIHVISNVELIGDYDYEQFVSLEQVTRVADKYREIDRQNDTLTCTLVLGDEFSVQMNSREFKKNIDPLFLNTLLTCRHHHISLIYDAQRFNHVDALLRQVTSYVVECKKVWRFMVQFQYDAYELENATNPTLITPIMKFGWFVEDKDYNAYDTLACVGNLKKSFEKGDMMTEEEILALQCNNGANMDVVTSPSRKYRKNKKRMK
ncbi:MAG: hypothetical protein IJD96_11690 [Lachnospiraceae bacterium]|nr:hypothetical protein [Lachnospiraceae bacterium]